MTKQPERTAVSFLIDIPARKLELVGVQGQEKTPAEMEAILAIRKEKWKPRPAKYPSGVLKIYSDHAVTPMEGGYMK